jgi:hypothetical protein
VERKIEFLEMKGKEKNEKDNEFTGCFIVDNVRCRL